VLDQPAEDRPERVERHACGRRGLVGRQVVEPPAERPARQRLDRLAADVGETVKPQPALVLMQARRAVAAPLPRARRAGFRRASPLAHGVLDCHGP